jgi:localization factor PodJL
VSQSKVGTSPVKQGRLTNGDLNLEKAREARGPLEHGLDSLSGTSPSLQPLPPLPSSEPPFLAWDDEMDAESQLQLYLDRAKEPKQKGFPPFEALSARLNELPAPAFQHTAKDAAMRQPHPSSPRRRAGDLEWFEERFLELKGMLSRRESDTSEIVSINVKLAEIIDRVDRLSAALPGEKTMVAVETQLAELSRSLEVTRAQSSSDANRIARAAQEILAATEKAQEARAGFEEAARHTVRELGQTVVVSASRAAAVTAEEITAALNERRDGGRLERVESELRSLNTVSRESCERTTAALERVHQTLRVFLERDQRDRSIGAPRKRAGVHNPITPGSNPYTIGEDFGSEPERKPRLDEITLRKPPPPDQNLLDAFKQASEKLIASKRSGFAKPGEGALAPSARHASGSAHRDEERSLPLFGLGIVAVVLLIASAALYYLHTKTDLPPFHLSVLPDVQPARTLPDLVPFSPQTGEAAPSKKATGAPKAPPSLFTAAENHDPSPSQPESREDLQMLANAASRGDREAQFRIAARFLSDEKLQGDPSTAARWLARAADQGHVESQFVLAWLYERGVGVPKDETVARELYHRAASAGHIRAMHNLGVLLCAQDTPQDYQEAAAWFASAAMSGLTDSQFNLAVFYERGLGLQQNNQKAYFWYEVASLAGDKEATRQAERLRRQLPDTETQAAAEQAGSWHPSVEQLPHLASGSASRS